MEGGSRADGIRNCGKLEDNEMQSSIEKKRGTIRQTLRQLESREALTQEDYDQLRIWAVDSNSEIRALIVGFLAQRTEQSAGELLLTLSRDPDPAVRAYALDVLCNFPGEECSDRLRDAAETEPDAAARFCAIRSLADVLAETEPSEALAYFQALFQRETEELCRLGCCYGRYLHGDRRALNDILRQLTANRADLRANALLILQDLADSWNFHVILTAVRRLEQKERSLMVQEYLADFFDAVKPLLRREKSNPWTMTRWESWISKDAPEFRSGLRLRFERDVHPEVRRGCLAFAKWLREYYVFPVRVPVYGKAAERVRAMDGEMVYGTCFCPERLDVEPYIKVANGSYAAMCRSDGKEDALAAILYTLAHELTHYFQWLNQLELTPAGAERQANRCAGEIVGMYMELNKYD